MYDNTKHTRAAWVRKGKSEEKESVLSDILFKAGLDPDTLEHVWPSVS
jgi:hypothetical protein